MGWVPRRDLPRTMRDDEESVTMSTRVAGERGGAVWWQSRPSQRAACTLHCGM